MRIGRKENQCPSEDSLQYQLKPCNFSFVCVRVFWVCCYLNMSVGLSIKIWNNGPMILWEWISLQVYEFTNQKLPTVTRSSAKAIHDIISEMFVNVLQYYLGYLKYFSSFFYKLFMMSLFSSLLTWVFFIYISTDIALPIF